MSILRLKNLLPKMQPKPLMLLLRHCSKIIFLLVFVFNSVCASEVNKCIKIGLVGEFLTYTKLFHQRFGDEIRRGVDIAKIFLIQNKQTCFNPVLIDIEGQYSQIPSLIEKKHNEGIDFFIGLGSSNQAYLSKQVLEKTGAILLSPTSTSDSLSDGKSRLILMSPTNDMIAKRLALEVLSKKIRKVVTIYSSNDKYSFDMNNAFVNTYKKNGGKIALQIAIRTGQVIDENQLLLLKKLDYEYIFLPLFEIDSAKIINFLECNKIHKPYIGADSWGTDLRVFKKLLSTGIRYMRPLIYSPKNNSKLNNYFYTKYYDVNKNTPTDLAAFSFEAIILLNEIENKCNLKKAVKDIRGCLRDKVKGYSGITGDVLYNYNLTWIRKIEIDVGQI